MTLEEIESQLRTVTDQVGRLMDQVSGKGLVPAFRCGHSQLLYPGDYLKQWGKLYGIGLGPTPVSEALDSDYDTELPAVDRSTKRLTQIMHGLTVCKSQMDFVLVRPEELEYSGTVLALGDEDYDQRAPILLERQLKRSQALKVLYAEFEKRNGPVTVQRRIV